MGAVRSFFIYWLINDPYDMLVINYNLDSDIQHDTSEHVISNWSHKWSLLSQKVYNLLSEPDK